MSFNDFKKQSSLITSSNPFNIGYVRTPLATGGVASDSDGLSRHPNQLVYTEGDIMTPSLGNHRAKREYLLNPLQKVTTAKSWITICDLVISALKTDTNFRL